MKFLFVIGFSKFFTHVLLFLLFHFYFSLSLPSLFPLFFSLSFISLFLFLPFKLTLPLLPCLKMCSHYFVVLFLRLYALIDALPIYFNQSCVPFSCHLPISSFHYFVACMFQALFVTINVACDVGPSVNWLPT